MLQPFPQQPTWVRRQPRPTAATGCDVEAGSFSTGQVWLFGGPAAGGMRTGLFECVDLKNEQRVMED